MKLLLIIYLALSIFTCNLNLQKVGDENEGHEFVFEGSEPFWNMEIKKIILNCTGTINTTKMCSSLKLLQQVKLLDFLISASME
jgi:uncharacterized membrane protein